MVYTREDQSLENIWYTKLSTHIYKSSEPSCNHRLPIEKSSFNTVATNVIESAICVTEMKCNTYYNALIDKELFQYLHGHIPNCYKFLHVIR